ncbi:MAG: MBL fold metallo-hydrolase, partial [Acidobacteriota bacterium]|nr:MBL fold metallo-hydrolase [Acidobacteriota bacterium]
MTGGTTTLTGRPARFTGGLRELAGGTFAWLQPNGAWGEANAGLVVGDGESMLIDTLWDEALAREMLAAMAPVLAEAPLRTVLNTHQDGDHWWGNAAVPADAEIITCEASRRAMEDESSPRELARLARLARSGRRLPGSLGGLSRLIDRMLSPFDLASVRLRHPDRAFPERALDIEVGGRPVHLRVLGPAHTPGDTIVHVPDAGVVFAADLLFVGAMPVMWHGPSTGWIAALEEMLALDAAIYVPGHGDVGGRSAVESMLRFWTWLRAGVAELRHAHHDALSISRALVASDGFEEWRDWECPERILITVTSVLRELGGRPPM